MGHLSSGVSVPHVRHCRVAGGCVHPDRILRLRHRFEVWRWSADLPDHLRKIDEGDPPTLKRIAGDSAGARDAGVKIEVQRAIPTLRLVIGFFFWWMPIHPFFLLVSTLSLVEGQQIISSWRHVICTLGDPPGICRL